MRTYYTVAFNGEIGYFETYATRQKAQKVADHFSRHYPANRYDVVEEETAQVRYLRVMHALPKAWPYCGDEHVRDTLVRHIVRQR